MTSFLTFLPRSFLISVSGVKFTIRNVPDEEGNWSIELRLAARRSAAVGPPAAFAIDFPFVFGLMMCTTFKLVKINRNIPRLVGCVHQFVTHHSNYKEKTLLWKVELLQK